ncbi:hypothetical protein ABKV19_016976 [Rosa sericea]
MTPLPKLYQSKWKKKKTRPKNDRAIDLGSPLLNDIADAFLTGATIGVTKVVAEDTYYAVNRGSVSSQDFEYTLKNMCKEGAYYGTVAGVFVTTEYGLESVRGRRDWKNTMIAGAMTGAVMSAVNKNNKDKILADAIVAGTIAGAALFLRNLATGSLRK